MNSTSFKLPSLCDLTNNNHLCLKDAKYFLDWISRMIQDPSKKTEWAIVLYSKIGGVGKNCMTDCLVKLIGEYSGFVSNIEDITKKFNAELCNKIFIYGDEINASAKKVADELKKVITGKEKNMERKGFDAIKIILDRREDKPLDLLND